MVDDLEKVQSDTALVESEDTLDRLSSDKRTRVQYRGSLGST